ncbi:MAG TPA: hypothetical protein VLS48_06620 [Anaerolineales bacterium]|nr:hypothetical protein [Anaerolineales bacterium]
MARKNNRRQSSQNEAVEIHGRLSIGAERDFNPDYSYVLKDLRRIGLLASMFFVILVALSFILG